MPAPTKKDPAPPATKPQAKAAAPAPAPKAAAATTPEMTPVAPTAKSESQTSKRAAAPDEIARRAYQLWQQRGGPHGDDQADWLRAESELSGGRRER